MAIELCIAKKYPEKNGEVPASGDFFAQVQDNRD